MNENTIIQPFAAEEQPDYSIENSAEPPSLPPGLFSPFMGNSPSRAPALPSDVGGTFYPISDALPFVILLVVIYLFVCNMWRKIIPKNG